MRDGDAGVPSPVEWLCEQVSERPYRVAAPADVLSQAEAEEHFAEDYERLTGRKLER